MVDAIQGGRQHHREGQVRIGRWIREAQLGADRIVAPWVYRGMRISAERLICAQPTYTGAS